MFFDSYFPVENQFFIDFSINIKEEWFFEIIIDGGLRYGGLKRDLQYIKLFILHLGWVKKASYNIFYETLEIDENRIEKI